MVTELDRLARSVPEARDVTGELTARQVELDLGGAVYDPRDPMGKLFFDAAVLPISTVLDAGGPFRGDP